MAPIKNKTKATMDSTVMGGNQFVPVSAETKIRSTPKVKTPIIKIIIPMDD